MIDNGRISRMRLFCCGSLVTICFAVFGLILMVLFNPVSTDISNSSLEFVIVVCRHGARAPLFFYPNDPYQSPEYWPDGKGTLTLKGKQQMYKVGQTYRKRYGKLFDFSYKPADLFVRSTGLARTYMSVALLLSGMFPPEGRNIWNPTINWQPIPIWQDSLDKTEIVTNHTECPKFTEEQNKVIKESSAYYNENLDFFKYLTKHTSLPINNLLDYIRVWDPIACEDANELPLPSWTKSVYPEKMSRVAGKIFKMCVSGTTLMNRLITGPLIKDFNSWISRKMNNEVSEKMLIHSGHDFTIIGLLSAVGFTEISSVNPAASLIFEFHKSTVYKHEVKMFYYNSSKTEEPLSLNMPKCKEPCPLSTFTKILQPFETDDDWHKECAA